MSYTIRILELADGSPATAPGYLLAFDPNPGNGRGDLITTPDPGNAKTFPTRHGALLFYTQQADPPHELRSDGQPNRPLTAYTVEIEKVDDAAR
jgi:hypothetical protein